MPLLLPLVACCLFHFPTTGSELAVHCVVGCDPGCGWLTCGIVIPGLAVPLVLRTITSYEPGGSPDRPRWRLVGPFYAKGIMDGERLEKREEQEFVLI